MTTSLIFLVLVGVALAAVTLLPIFGRREAWDHEQAGGALTALRLQRDRILRSIKDLEFERQTGILSEDEFRRLRGDFKRRGVEAMKALERARRTRVRTLRSPRAALSAAQRRKVETLVQNRKEST